MNDSKSQTKAPRFTRAGENLLQATATGAYFLYAKVGGKLYNYSLQTDNLAQAKRNRDAELEKLRNAEAAGNDGRGKLTLREALALAVREVERRNGLKGKSDNALSDCATVSYLAEARRLTEGKYAIPAADLDRQIGKVTFADCQKWFTPIQKDFGATVHNTAKLMLSDAFELAIKKFAARVNPAKELEHVRQQPKELSLPTPEQYTALLNCIRASAAPASVARREIVRQILRGYRKNVEVNYGAAFAEHPEWKTALGLDKDNSKKAWHKVYDLAHYLTHQEKESSRRGQESADLVEFLAYTGARSGETAALTWDRVDLERGVISFPRETTKGERRTKAVAINAALLPVLKRCQDRATRRNDCRVFGIASCNKAISNACERLNFPHWSHHDFRHLFASEALCNGAAPLLVAEALGHSDKGRTLMDRYAHANAIRAAALVQGLRFGVQPQGANAAKIADLKAQLAALEAAA